ncbi:MAG: hypothetical protein IT208_10655 [Chthonomonadales bacterium]|nr:hypothetical protein [Chthonomonadales bacterium]
MLILSIVASLGAAAYSRVLFRSWYNPVALFAAAMVGYTLIGVALLGGAARVSSAMLWVAVCTFALGCGATAAAFTAPLPVPGAARTEWSIGSTRLRCVMIGLFVVATVGLWVTWRNLSSLVEGGINATLLGAVAEVSHTARAEIGYGTKVKPVFEMLVMPWFFLLPLLGGLLWAQARGTLDRVLSIASVGPVMIQGMLYGSRMGILYGGSFWLGALIAGSVYLARGAVARSLFPILLRAALVAVLAGPPIMLVMLIRYNDVDAGAGKGFRYMAAGFGFVHAFGTWLDEGDYARSDRLLGYRTAWRVYDRLGAQPVQPWWEQTYTDADNPNILTAIQGLVEDFGGIGTFLVMFVCGYLGALWQRRVVLGDIRYLALLTSVYAAAFMAPSFSLTQYNAPVLALVLLQLAVLFVATARSPAPVGAYASSQG